MHQTTRRRGRGHELTTWLAVTSALVLLGASLVAGTLANLGGIR